MKRNKLRSLTLTSVLSAIIILMTFVPQLGYITLGITEMTLIHIPVLIGVFLLEKRYSIFLGLLFGVTSLIKALQINAGMAIAFINPLVSVLPRLLFVLVAYYIFKLLKLLATKKHGDIFLFSFVSFITIFGIHYGIKAVNDFTAWNETLLNVISLILMVLVINVYFAYIKQAKAEKTLYASVLLISTVLHTLLVLFAALIFAKTTLVEVFQTTDIVGILISIALTNGLVEALLASFIGTPIIIALLNLKEGA